jgi:predicted TIM-barrel fold metal-dependent hydrolase
VSRAVAVQPRSYGDDHAYLLQARVAHPDRIIAVAAPDPRSPSLRETVAALAATGIRGLRLDPLGDPGVLLPDVAGSSPAARVADAAAEHGLVVELLAEVSTLAPVASLARGHPGVSFVIEHLGLYGAAPGASIDPLLRLSDRPNVYSKVSALASISTEPPPYPDLHPAIRRALRAFGADRLMWGSDLPWIGADAYPHELAAVDALRDLSAPQRSALRGGTACSVFGA